MLELGRVPESAVCLCVYYSYSRSMARDSIRGGTRRGCTDRALTIDDVSGVVSRYDCSSVDSAVQGRQ